MHRILRQFWRGSCWTKLERGDVVVEGEVGSLYASTEKMRLEIGWCNVILRFEICLNRVAY